MTAKRIYVRCNGGDLFDARLAVCPLDGWSSPETMEVTQVARRLDTPGEDVSLERLREAGLCEAALARVIVMEFGSEEATFDALSPDGYVLDGQWTPLRLAGTPFK